MRFDHLVDHALVLEQLVGLACFAYATSTSLTRYPAVRFTRSVTLSRVRSFAGCDAMIRDAGPVPVLQLLSFPHFQRESNPCQIGYQPIALPLSYGVTSARFELATSGL